MNFSIHSYSLGCKMIYAIVHYHTSHTRKRMCENICKYARVLLCIIMCVYSWSQCYECVFWAVKRVYVFGKGNSYPQNFYQADFYVDVLSAASIFTQTCNQVVFTGVVTEYFISVTTLQMWRQNRVLLCGQFRYTKCEFSNDDNNGGYYLRHTHKRAREHEAYLRICRR